MASFTYLMRDRGLERPGSVASRRSCLRLLFALPFLTPTKVLGQDNLAYGTWNRTSRGDLLVSWCSGRLLSVVGSSEPGFFIVIQMDEYLVFGAGSTV